MNPDVNLLINLLKRNKSLSSTELSSLSKLGLRSVQRLVNGLVGQNLILKTGFGKNTNYSLAPLAILNYEPKIELDLSENRLENDIIDFNFEIFKWLKEFNFNEVESPLLKDASFLYQSKIKQSDSNLKKKEYQRLVVEFSWKSSSIEGDTYTLLDTQRLLEDGIINQTKTAAETQMILNHKLAFDFIFENPDYFKELSVKKLIELHKLLTTKLDVNTGFRISGVGITGSLYKPLDNQHQIQEAVEKLIILLNSVKNPYLKALFVSVLIPYIQPFEDGNKRTSRVMANGILYSYGLPLLSYRNTNIEDYRNSVLSFYELNSIFLFKKIFVDQVVFFSKGYF